MVEKKLKIAICGDSFGATVSERSWPSLLQEEYDAEIVCRGEKGWSLFHAYERLLENIDGVDYIIFCITDPSRLSSPFKVPISVGDIYDNKAYEHFDKKKFHIHKHGIPSTRFNAEELRTAIKYYYKMLYDDTYMEIVQKGLLKEIEDVVKDYKCIFLKSFNTSFPSDYIPKKVVWGNLNLYQDISLKEVGLMSKEEIEFMGDKGLYFMGDPRSNHINEENNYNLFSVLRDIIDEDNWDSREVNMDKYFSHLDGVTEKQIKNAVNKISKKSRIKH